MQFRVRDWGRYKHFKDRNAPWVKLNKDLLNSRDWFDLPADTARVLVMLWLLASEDPEREGNLPDEAELAFRLRMKASEIRDHMGRLGKWLEQTDTGVKTVETTVAQTDNIVISQEPPKYDTPVTAPKTPRKNKPSDKKKYAKHSYSDGFEKFWALYPKKAAKGNSFKKYVQVTATTPATEIITGLQRQLDDSRFKEDPKHFTFAETWLHQKRWELKTPK